MTDPSTFEAFDQASASRLLGLSGKLAAVRTGAEWTRFLSRRQISAAELRGAAEAWPILSAAGRKRLLCHPSLSAADQALVLDWMSLEGAIDERHVEWDPSAGSWKTRITLQTVNGAVAEAGAVLTPELFAALALRSWSFYVLASHRGRLLYSVPAPRATALIEMAARRWRADVVSDLLRHPGCPRPLLDMALDFVDAHAEQVEQERARAQRGGARFMSSAGETGGGNGQRVEKPRLPASDGGSWRCLSDGQANTVVDAAAANPSLLADDVRRLLAHAAELRSGRPRPRWNRVLSLLDHPALTPAGRARWLRERDRTARRTPSEWERVGGGGGDNGGAYSIDTSARRLAEWPVRDQIRILRQFGLSLSTLQRWMWHPHLFPPTGEVPAAVRLVARALWGKTAQSAAAMIQGYATRHTRGTPDGTREDELEDGLLAKLLGRPETARDLGPFLLETWRRGSGRDPRWAASHYAALAAHLGRLGTAGQTILREAMLSKDSGRREDAIQLLLLIRTLDGASLAEHDLVAGHSSQKNVPRFQTGAVPRL